jgi:predicted transport protein
MSDMDKAIATQLKNIETRTGKPLKELAAIVKKSGLQKHGELVAMLKSSLGMGHGDANTLVHIVLQSDGQSAAKGLTSAEVLDGLYAGPKSGLRSIHDKLLKGMKKLGAFEEAPKKTYVSYRRKKQFVMIGPASKTRVEVGLNMKGVPATDRLEEMAPGKMCNYRVNVTDAAQVDAELLGWIKTAFESAG